jgi:hypothetical protein
MKCHNKMVKQSLSMVFMILGVVLMLTQFVPAPQPACNGNPGSIKTTTSACTGNANQYAIGEKVYISGSGFCPGTYNWTITGQPGGASCDSNKIVATATTLYNVDSSGAFCFEAYTVANDDCGEYKADFNGKNDNYHVNENLPVVPEFGLIAGIATILGALGMVFVARKK